MLVHADASGRKLVIHHLAENRSSRRIVLELSRRYNFRFAAQEKAESGKAGRCITLAR